MATQTNAKNKPDKLKRLNFLIGKWHTAGEILKSNSGAAQVIRGMDTYEWISGGRFILHTVDVLIGNARTEVVEIIGYDEASKKYFMTSYDNTGAIITMTATLEKNGVLKLGDNKMKAVLSVNKNGSMTAKWQLFEKTWKPWMEIKLTR